MRTLLGKLQWLLQGRRKEAELQEELQFHLAESRLLQSFLFDMQPNDPRALSFAVLILLGAAVLAGYAPARRASRVDPLVALRHD